MSCLNPTQAWQDLRCTTSNGCHPVIFSFKDLDPQFYRYEPAEDGSAEFVSSRYVPFSVPCGCCILCRKARAYEITCRAWMELMAHPELPASFITLTVDDEHMPQVFPGMVLQHRPWQLFAKRFRKSIGEFRYMMCGEYGEKYKRPHYHAIIFGWEPRDRSFNDDGTWCDSVSLKRIWPYGNIMARRVNFNAIAYVAGYQLKLDNDMVDVDGLFSNEEFLESEGKVELRNYVKWSRKPGLGYDFLIKFPDMIRDLTSRCDDGKEYLQRSFTLVNGRVMPFHSRYLLKVLKDMRDGVKDSPLTLKKEFDIIQASKERGVLLRHLHSSRCAKEACVMNLKNRAELLNLQLARKSRDFVA